jgi:hypothetical protein
LPCFAQQEVREDSVVSQMRKISYRPTQLRFATDLVSLVKTFAQDDYNGWEANLDVDFYRYYLAIDMGASAREQASENDQYTNKGTYFRFGADINFLLKDEDRNMLYFGGRYARSMFSETLVVSTIDPVWGEYQNAYTNDNANARWFELTGGLKVRMWKNLWLGYTARYKFWLKTNDSPDMEPYEIPGYGTTNKKSTWGFNYQVLISIPLPKRK